MKTILLLEDLPEIRAWLRALVVQVFPGSTVVESARVHDALQQVGAHRFDLAMIDLGLPDGSGVKVVQALREAQPDAQSVVVTIHDDDDHLFPALQAGGIGLLKAWQGPFGDVRFCPTGGIHLGNAPEFLALSNVACVGGSWIVPGDAIASGDWARIETLAREASQLPR